MSGKILVLDDDRSACELIEAALAPQGYEVHYETRGRDALDRVSREEFDALVTDLQMDDMDGFAVCERVLGTRPDLPVVVVTGHASLESAVQAIRAGAYDYLTKPIDLKVLSLVVARAVQHHRLRDEVHRLRTAVAESQGFERLLGSSAAMRRVFDVVGRVAGTDATVLVTGESGTGKELVARAIHARSPRREGPFVAINCAAVPAQLLESELFGHAKGAFTDAKASRKGLFLEANGGTLFLDEIGEMPLDMQVKLLRALQERVVRAVGGSSETPFDARVIAATNRDLESEVHERRFREDLYYRINVVTVEVPPLRERGTDVPLLAQHFVQRFAARHGKKVLGISAPAAEKLVAYHWPGNVRELENSIERAVALTQFDQLTVEDLPERIRQYRADQFVLVPETVDDLVTADELERRYVNRVLALVNGNKSRAARILGFDRRTLYRKLERLATREAEPVKSAPAPRRQSDRPAPPSNTSSSNYDTREPRRDPAPLAKPHDAEEPDARPKANGHTNGHAKAPGISVLVVDDDHDALELLQLLLEGLGFRVTTAGSVAEAVDAGPADVIVTDVLLPDGRGEDLAKRFAPKPVIAMTGLSSFDVSPQLFRACLTKPVSTEKLAAAVRAAFASTHAGSNAVTA